MTPTFVDEFASNFVRRGMLVENFNKNKPVGPATGKALWFERRYDSVPGTSSANDLLRAYLQENGYEYINTFTGEVWFLYRGNWHTCEAVVQDGFYRFYLQEYELG